MSSPAESAAVAEQIRTGMRAQLAHVGERIAAGHTRLGWKIGINDPRLQRRLGLVEPVAGSLTSDRQLAPNGVYRIVGDAQILVEGEIAILLGDAISPPQDRIAANAAIAALEPAIEVVDLHRPRAGLSDLVAHSTFHEAVVWGRALALPPDRDPRTLAVRVLRNGTVERKADPELTAPSFADLVLVVARRLAACKRALAAGERILSGSFTTGLTVSAGDEVTVEVGGIGSVTLRFAS